MCNRWARRGRPSCMAPSSTSRPRRTGRWAEPSSRCKCDEEGGLLRPSGGARMPGAPSRWRRRRYRRTPSGTTAASFRQVTYTFDVPGSADHPTLVVPTHYFIGRLVVFTIGSHLSAPGFTRTTLPVGGHQVPALQAQAVPPGSTLAIGVDGPPAVASVTPPAPAVLT